MRLIPMTLALLAATALSGATNADDATKTKQNRVQSVAEKLAKMKPDISVKSGEEPNTAPILLYTVEGSLLDGEPAAICDINNCRIAILGKEISATQPPIKSLNLRVAGSDAKEQAVNGTDGKPFFFSKYESSKQSKKAKCRFHKFEFDMTDRLLSYGPRKAGGYRGSGTLWANPSNAGVLILVDSSTGKFTTHGMRPKSKRVMLPGSGESEDKRK